LGNRGAEIVAKAVKDSLSIVTLNISSNDIGNTGMIKVFTELTDNISLQHLNVSTFDGKHRNIITNSGVKAV
jgi:hypothetical protein